MPRPTKHAGERVFGLTFGLLFYTPCRDDCVIQFPGGHYDKDAISWDEALGGDGALVSGGAGLCGTGRRTGDYDAVSSVRMGGSPVPPLAMNGFRLGGGRSTMSRRVCLSLPVRDRGTPLTSEVSFTHCASHHPSESLVDLGIEGSSSGSSSHAGAAGTRVFPVFPCGLEGFQALLMDLFPRQRRTSRNFFTYWKNLEEEVEREKGRACRPEGPLPPYPTCGTS
jgi:hypothetical protein